MGVCVTQERNDVAFRADLLFERQGDAAVTWPPRVHSRVHVPQSEVVIGFVRLTFVGKPTELDRAKELTVFKERVEACGRSTSVRIMHTRGNVGSSGRVDGTRNTEAWVGQRHGKGVRKGGAEEGIVGTYVAPTIEDQRRIDLPDAEQ